MHSFVRGSPQSVCCVIVSQTAGTTRVFVPWKNTPASLLKECPVNVWKQQQQHNSVFLNNKWILVCRKSTMLYYATCNNCATACVTLPQECTMKVQEGKFKLQDLLVVPMQRVLKYHLLLKVKSKSVKPVYVFTQFHSNVIKILAK